MFEGFWALNGIFENLLTLFMSHAQQLSKATKILQNFLLDTLALSNLNHTIKLQK